MEVHDINYNPNSTSAKSHMEMEIPTRPIAVVRSGPPKKLQFATIPTIQELDKGISPPGFTPINSATNIIVSSCTTPTTATTLEYPKMLHSSTSLEVLMGDESSLPSACTSNSNTDTKFTLTPKEQHPCILQAKRRNSSVPATKTASTGPEQDLEIVKSPPKTAASTLYSKVSSKRFSTTPNKSILRKPPSPEKDSNCNIINQRTEGSDSPPSSVKTSHKSVQNDAFDDEGDSTEELPAKNDAWESVKKTLSSNLSPLIGSQIAQRKNYMTPRARARSIVSSSSSSILGPRHRFEGLSDPGGSSEMLMPLKSKREDKFKMKARRLPQLSSVISELKQKEVVFDRATAIQGLKTRILRGEKVSHEEIQAIRNLTLPPHERHLGYRLPWSTDLYCQKGLVYIATPNKQPPEKNTFGTIDDLRIPYEDEFTMEHYGRRQYILNLSGFRDEHISLYLEGRNRLVIRAVRHNGMVIDPDSTPMSVTETILLPPDLPADNLRIVRKPSGTTIIEESWRY